MSIKQKTNLFRFVTVRSPQTISEEREDLGFLKHPNPNSGSYFDNELSDPASTAQNFIDAAEASPFFSPDTSTELKGVSGYKDLWEFALWLGRNNGKITRDLLDEAYDGTNATLPAILNDAGNNDVWDNLYYQIVFKENPNVREVCHQIITASNFVDRYNDFSVAPAPTETEAEMELRLAQEFKDLNRLANLKIVLNYGLATPKQAVNNSTLSGNKRINPDIVSKHKSKLAEVEINHLKSIKAELLDLENQYTKDYTTALKLAAESNVSSVTSAISAFKTANPDLFNEEQSLSEKVDIETTSGAGNTSETTSSYTAHNQHSLKHIPSHIIPALDFEYAKPLSTTYTASNATELTKKFVSDNTLTDKNIEEAVAILEDMIDEKKSKCINVDSKMASEMVINGVVTAVVPSTDKTCVASFNTIIEEVGGAVIETYSMYLTVETNIPASYFKSIDAKLYFDGSSTATVQTDQYEVISNEGNELIVELLKDSPLTSLESGVSFELSGTFELGNGADYDFAIHGNTATEFATGQGTPTVTTGDPADLHYGINKVGVVDYRRVEQELFAYVPGEVSHIENVMAKEYKERSVRNTLKSENSFETETERENEKENEISVNQTESFSSEVANVIDEENSTDFGINASAGGKIAGKVEFSIGSNLDISKSTSISNSDTSAREFAEDITERALEKMKQKTSIKRKTKIVEEVESKISQGFDNREGTENITGVYRWIDKVYKNRIVNYGKKLLYEFMIPEPARFYKDAIIQKSTDNNAASYGSNEHNVLIKPSHPKDHGIKSAVDITRANYASMGALYGIDLVAPKNKYVTTTKTISESFEDYEIVNSSYYSDLRVETDYQCVYTRSRIDYIRQNSDSALGFMYLKVANLENNRPLVAGTGTDAFWITGSPDGSPEGELGIAINCEYVKGYSLFVQAKSKWKFEKFQDWRNDIYEKVLTVYEEKLSIYNAAVKQQELDEKASAKEQLMASADKVLTHNAMFNEDIIKTELKRLCIEMLIAPFDFTQGQNFYGEDTYGVPSMNVSEDLDFYSSSVKFFEQAFDWDLLAKKFYPYYWANKSDWKALFQSQNSMDHIFKAFLQSGMARVMVPVREGFEDAVVYFMETGDIWNGSGITLDSHDKLYLSLVDEATSKQGVLEDLEWETVVPTSLSILQDRSVIVDEGGLPLTINDPDSTLIESTKILGETDPV